MHSDVIQLLEVQNLDQEIMEVQDQLDNYPRLWEEVKSDLRHKKEAAEAAARAMTNHQDERTRIEKELRASTETLKKYKTQQMMVKTSKELHAINKQIESLHEQIARLEERGQVLLETDTSRKEQRDATAVELEAAKAAALEERERIRKQVNSKKTLKTKLEKERDRHVQQVDEELLHQYTQIRKRWPRNPIVPARNGSCGGCNFALLPNKLVDVHKATEVTVCDNCGRVLSEDETNETETSAAGAGFDVL